MISIRYVWIFNLLVLTGIFSIFSQNSAQAIEVTDLAGRKVTLSKPAQKIVLGEGRFLHALGILDREDPAQRVIGMLNDFQRFDPEGYAQYKNAFPHIAKIETFGRTSRETVSVEKLISLKPDLAIFGISGHGPSSKSKVTIDLLKAADIPIVFIDFRLKPLENTPKSIEILGALLGRQVEAKTFNDFYKQQLDLVSNRLSKAAIKKPRVFIEVHVGLRNECCFTIANGMLSTLIEYAGGINMAKGLVPGMTGTVNIEHLIANPPDIYIGTAIGSTKTWNRKPARIALGAGVSRETAKKSISRALDRTGVADFPAVKAKRAFAIWHHFYNSPLNVFAVQAFAKAFHPKLFTELSPRDTLKQLFDRFQAVPLNGIYWTQLE